MARLDERQIISIFQKTLANKKFVSEDVEQFKVGRQVIVVKTDTLVSRTDMPPKMKLGDAARKSVVACVSDFASKGVMPSHCIISVSLPRQFSRTKIVQLARGFRDASREFGFEILGGDTNEARDLVISVAMFGVAQRITRRGGARAGDVIIVTGPFGRTGAGLAVALHQKKADAKFARTARCAVYHASPRLRFGVAAARYMTSAMDSSDGLSTTLIEMSTQSRKKFIVTKIPMDVQLLQFARTNRLDVTDLVFNSGEEYEIVATVPQRHLSRVRQIAKRTQTSMIEIGYVRKGAGVFLQDRPVKDKGWAHFRS